MTESLGLVIASPALVRFLRLLGVLLSAALLVLIGQGIFGWPRHWPRLPGVAALAPLLLLVGGMTLPSTGFGTAAFPSPDLLQQLKQRLTEPAPCRPHCADVMEAAVAVAPESLTMQLDIAVAEPSAVPLPGKPGAWEGEG